MNHIINESTDCCENQIIRNVNGTNTFFNQSTGITAELGATYYCSLRYRTDDTAWRMYLRGSADPFILGLPLNVGDAVFWEGTVAATVANQIILRFMGLSGRPSGYLEVDDIVLYKL